MHISVPILPSASARPRSLLIYGAPLAALLAGMAAEWLGFRALRLPLLLMVGFGVLATLLAAGRGQRGWPTFVAGVGIGFLTWAGAELVYAIIHLATGQRFDAGRFGPQWSQGVMLVLAHGLFLGAPTGVVAGLLAHAPGVRGLAGER